VGEHVEDRGAGLRLAHQRLQLLGLRVTVDLEGDPDVLEPVADARVETEDAAQVDVTLDLAADSRAARRRGRTRCCRDLPSGRRPRALSSSSAGVGP
jgi:hypothetical protein